MKEFTFNAWILCPRQIKKLKRPTKGWGYIAATKKELLKRGEIKECHKPTKIKVIIKV